MRALLLAAAILIFWCPEGAFYGSYTLSSTFHNAMRLSTPCSKDQAKLRLKGDERAIEPLTVALRAEGEQVRSQAAWALGLKGDARAIEPLIAALKDGNAHVRSQAAWALGLKGDGRSVEPLKVALNDSDEHVRKQAAWALQLRGLKSR